MCALLTSFSPEGMQKKKHFDIERLYKFFFVRFKLRFA